MPNDVHCAGAFHKIGWRGIPSIALNFGESGDCHGWLVGEPHRGISYMFQMMNEARIMVGHERRRHGVGRVLRVARVRARRARRGGRSTSKNPATPQVPIIEHADVRRMLLRQKAIVEGGPRARRPDRALRRPRRATAPTPDERAARVPAPRPADAGRRRRSPPRRGFESNALAVQIHGGYGYTSEYLPEAWLRDQKLNSIHEGTTGMHSMDLLGRKVVAEQGGALRLLADEIGATVRRATRRGRRSRVGRRARARGGPRRRS